jgi:ribosomal protein S18 acetylase RimI-like enzyme
VIAISSITDADVSGVVALWHRCNLTRPWNDPASDIAFARKGANASILVGRHEGEIAATAMVGHDGHRGWVYYVAVDPDLQGKDFGRTIMAAAEDWLRQQGVEKAMLMVRADNTKVRAFYDKLGYETQERVVYARWLDGRPMTP